jgi:hypothetical protein
MRFDLTDMPDRIRALPRDRRGYPIPAIVFRDAKGDPHFTMNDQAVADRFRVAGRCGICGGGLGRYRCFVGGPASAFHPMGRYFDGPVHEECGAFALRVCPYLALAGSYARRIGSRTLKPDALGEGTLVTHDPTVHAPQPAVFVLASTTGYDWNGQHFLPQRPWAKVRFFCDGEEVSNSTARALAEADETAAAPFRTLAWPAPPPGEAFPDPEAQGAVLAALEGRVR